MVDFYFDEARGKERGHILQLVRQKDSSSDEILRGYVREAMRQCFFHVPQNIGLTHNFDRSQPSSKYR